MDGLLEALELALLWGDYSKYESGTAVGCYPCTKRAGKIIFFVLTVRLCIYVCVYDQNFGLYFGFRNLAYLKIYPERGF